MNSLDSAFLQRLTLNPKDAAAWAALSVYQGRQELHFQQTAAVLETLVRVAKVESVESSNRIEGIVSSRAVIEGIVLRDVKPRNRDGEEIAGYRDALALIHESGQNMPFQSNVILQLHSQLYRYETGREGGRWKLSDNEIVAIQADGSRQTRFRPVSAFETPGAMAKLMDRYQNAVEVKVSPLYLVPLTILDFLCIHPFDDGNGRVSRLLTLMLLYHSGHEVGRYISLERVVEQTKERYYDALQQSSQNWHTGEHDPMPWLRYFWSVLGAAYKEFEERVGTVRKTHGAKTEVIEKAVGRHYDPFAISDIVSDCPGISRETIRVVLANMKKAGSLKLEGSGRGAKYRRIY